MKNLHKNLFFILFLNLFLAQIAFAGDGTSCASPKPASLGVNVGNGDDQQFFSFVPTEDMYVKFTTNNPNSSIWPNLTVYKGDCSSLQCSYFTYLYSSSYLDVTALKANTAYTFECLYLNGNELEIIKLAELPKEIVSFTVFNSEGNISAAIDTVANNITITAPSNIELSNLQYSFNTLYQNIVTVHGDTITNSGTMDFNNLSEIVISDPLLKSTTYKVVVKKINGLSCGSAINSTGGIMNGNGLYNTYFKYTATSSDYIQITTSSPNTVLFDMYEGNCAYLNRVSDYIFYEGSSTFQKVVEGQTYYLYFSNLYNYSVKIENVAEISKDFKSFSIYADGKSYTAVIDTVSNTLIFDIPSDLDLSSIYLNYQTTVSKYLEVYANGSILDIGQNLDFSAIETIEIKEQAGKQAFYSVVFNYVKGLSCGSSTVIGEGDIVSVGDSYQMYSFTPSKKGYIEISSNSNNYSWTYIYENDCDWDNTIFNGGITSSYSHSFLVDPNNTYYIRSQFYEGEVLHLEYIKDVPKEFSSFGVEQLGNTYSAKIDTLFNTLSFTIPSNIDLSNLKCNFSTVGNLETYVKVNNAIVLSGGNIDLSKTDTIMIVDANSESEVYTVFFTKADAISCSSARVAKEGSNKGNGQSVQYFSFTPTKSGVVTISSSTGWMNLDTYSGTCESLVEEYCISNYNDQSSLLKVTAGSTYIFRCQYLEFGSLQIDYVDEIPKELSTMHIGVGYSDYYAIIDQDTKIVTLNVPSDLDLTNTYIRVQLRIPTYTQMYISGKALGNEACDLREVKSIEIKDLNGQSVNYSLVVNRVLGLNCSSPIIAKEGNTKALGDYDTYFKFVSSKTGFVNIGSLRNWASIEIRLGDCDYRNIIASGSTTKDGPLLLQVQTDSTYLIRANGLQNDSLNISYVAEIPKRINTFSIRTDFENYYYSAPSVVDQEAKTITITVPSDFDLSNVSYSITLESAKYTAPSYNGTVIPLSGTLNFNLSPTIKVKDVQGGFVTYSLVFDRIDGISCGTSYELKLDSLQIIEDETHFFNYMAENDGYITALAYDISNLQIYQGSCNSLIGVPVDLSYGVGESRYLFKVEAGKTYYLSCRSYNIGSLVLKSQEAIPLEFRSFYLTVNGNSIVAEVDTVANKLTFNVPSDIDESGISYSFSVESSSYSRVTHNDVVLSNYGTIDISSDKLLIISDAHQNREIYSIELIKKEGLSCGTSIEAKVGKTLVNGEYYKFVPAKTAYYSIYPTDSEYVSLHSGECGNLNTIDSKYANQGSPFIVRGDEGVPLFIKIRSYNTSYIVIEEFTEIPKEFTEFKFRDGSSFGLSFPALIDTALNTVTITVPTDFDLSNVLYSFQKTGDKFSQVRSDNSILENSGILNFANRESISIVDFHGNTETYSLIIKRSEGLSCSTALPIAEGVTVGNGSQFQFYTFTSVRDGVIELTPSNNGVVRFMVGVGECDAFENPPASNSYTSDLTIPVKSGTKYTIAVVGLLENELYLRYLNPIPKEFTYFIVKNTYFGNTYYSSLIDTISNQIIVGIPLGTELNQVQCSFEVTASTCNRVSLNGSILNASGYYFLTDSNVVTITDIYGQKATYSLVLKEMRGITCSQALIATEGVTRGNGLPSQVFSFTAQKSGFVNISGSLSAAQISVSRGMCGNLVSIASGYKSVSIYVNGGDTYVISAQNLYRNNLSIEFVDSMNKEFTYFAVMDNKTNNYYVAQIDTISNTLLIAVPQEFALGNLEYFFSTTNDENCKVLVEGYEIPYYSAFNYEEMRELQIVDANFGSTTYTINLYRINEVSFNSFNIPGQISSKIDFSSHKIDILMPDGSNLKGLVPSFTLSKGAVAKIGLTPQISGISVNDFSKQRNYSISNNNGLLSANWTVNVSNGSTSIEVNKADSFLLDVYPNPSHGIFHVKMGEISNKVINLKVFTLTGNLVWSKFLDNSSNETFDLDLSGFPSGIYILQASGCQCVKSVKLVVD